MTKHQVGGDETTSSKGCAIEKSPEKAILPKNHGTSHTCDNLDSTLVNLEARMSELDDRIQKHMCFFRKKQAVAISYSKIDKKLDEYEKSSTEVAEMDSHTHLRKKLNRKVKAIVKDIIEDAIEDVIEDVIDDLVHEKLAVICTRSSSSSSSSSSSRPASFLP